METKHPDRDSYEKIWETLINIEIINYKKTYPNCIKLIPNVKEEIWEKYVSLNSYCKTNYMKSSIGKIDRHKVAACYMIAIAITRPMRFIKKIDGENVALAINEKLAITIGLSLVRAFAIAAINDNKSLSENEKKKQIDKFSKGIKTPENSLINHGTYIENFANEIYFTSSEGKMSILSLAHELYLLEVITKISDEQIC